MHSLEYVKKLVQSKFENHPDRLIHTEGVVKMATYLATIYHQDITRAQIAAYMHDFCKYDSTKDQIQLLMNEDLEECENYPVLYHSYASAEFYLQKIANDKDVYNAIRNHVFGRLGMSKLEEIILISDYTEENRKYENCIFCRKLLLDGNFYEAIYQSTKFTIEFLESKEMKPHPLQIQVLNYYKELCDQ